MITLREKIGTFVEGPKVQGFVLALIIANAITLGLETVPSIADAYGVWCVPLINSSSSFSFSRYWEN